LEEKEEVKNRVKSGGAKLMILEGWKRKQSEERRIGEEPQRGETTGVTVEKKSLKRWYSSCYQSGGEGERTGKKEKKKKDWV